MNNPTSPNIEKLQSKVKNSVTQKQTIFFYLKENIATASMVTAATAVPQKCICRYKRELEKSGLLWELVKKECKTTGFKAWYLTTDKKKAPLKTQNGNLSNIDSEGAAELW